MIGVPTSTVFPRGTSSSTTVPACGEGSSTSDLAVSISQTTSLTATVSPGATRQVTDLGLGQPFADVGEGEGLRAHRDSFRRGCPGRRVPNSVNIARNRAEPPRATRID